MSVDILGMLAHLIPSNKALDIHSKIGPPNPFKQSRCYCSDTDEQQNLYCAALAVEVAAVHQTKESPTDRHSVSPYGKAISSHELDKNKNFSH